MTQNVYDNPDFFAGYSRLPRSVAGLDGAPEWPSLRALLPELTNCQIVDLGCGFGWFCRWAADHGAAGVLGIDVSERMLAQAAKMTSQAVIRFQRMDLATLSLPQASFDLAYSSLAFHYIPDLPSLMKTVAAAMKPGGHLVFSVEHPIFTASAQAGWITDEAGRRFWRVDSYQNQGPRRTNWLTEGVIKQHRTIGAYTEALLEAGLTVRRIVEWTPTEQQIAADPALAPERERPMFLLMAATK